MLPAPVTCQGFQLLLLETFTVVLRYLLLGLGFGLLLYDLVQVCSGAIRYNGAGVGLTNLRLLDGELGATTPLKLRSVFQVLHERIALHTVSLDVV